MSTKKTPTRSHRKRQTAKAKWTQEEYLVDALAYFEDLAASAFSKNPAAADRAKAHAVKIRNELDQLRATRDADRTPLDPDGHTEEVLREIRRMRIGATEAGVYTAAAKLIEQEQSLLRELREERRQAELEQLMAEDLGTIVSEITTLIRTLPESLLDEIRQAVYDRDNPRQLADDVEELEG